MDLPWDDTEQIDMASSTRMTCEKGFFFPSMETPVVTIGAVGPSGLSPFVRRPQA